MSKPMKTETNFPKYDRETLGLSRREMAALMGVHRETWAKWERGERRPDNAATRMMALLVWLHANNREVLDQWSRISLQLEGVTGEQYE